MKRTVKATDKGVFVYMDDRPINKKEKQLIAELIAKDKSESEINSRITKRATKTKAQP